MATDRQSGGELWGSPKDQPSAVLGNTEMSGATITGGGKTTLVILGANGMIVHLELKKGFLQPGHSHPEHESLGYVLSGRIRMVVGDSERILSPGESWRHPVGVHHVTEALEDSSALEVHVPLRPDILERFGLA